jgi:CDP-glycerol glycerophosphotransferase (TagB/SpsB family)
VITDYSSMAFNAAYIDRPVVYFQFDRTRFLDGGHIGRHGYFDYHRDGFGPVALDVDAAVAAITETIEFGASPRPLYQARIDETFPMRDGQCSKRVVAAIRASTKAAPPIRVATAKPAAPQADGERERPARGFTPTATAEES